MASSCCATPGTPTGRAPRGRTKLPYARSCWRIRTRPPWASWRTGAVRHRWSTGSRTRPSFPIGRRRTGEWRPKDDGPECGIRRRRIGILGSRRRGFRIRCRFAIHPSLRAHSAPSVRTGDPQFRIDPSPLPARPDRNTRSAVQKRFSPVRKDGGSMLDCAVRFFKPASRGR